jgi:hypothetical protein
VEPTCAFADIILPSTQPNLFIAPSRIALAKLESKLVGELDAHYRLRIVSSPYAPITRTSSSTVPRRWDCSP